ncbi:unnamed protein product [Prunus brigantina]
MIYGVSEAITGMVLRRLEKSRVLGLYSRSLERRSRPDRTCVVRSNQGKHGWV